MLRILALVPLLAAGVDLTRAQLLCGPEAQSCLEAAGRGWLGPLAIVLLIAYAIGAGLLLARRGPTPSFGRAWLVATVALATVVNGQDLLGQLLGADSLALAPVGTFGLCAAAGALLAAALRTIHSLGDLAPRAPRALLVRPLRSRTATPAIAFVPKTVTAPHRGRGPPTR